MTNFLQLPPQVASYVAAGAPSASVGKHGDFYTNSSTTELFQKINNTWTLVSGGGGSGVSSVNGYAGVVTLVKSDLGGTQDISTVVSGGNFRSVLQLSGAGVVQATPGLSTDATTDGLRHEFTATPNALSGSFNARWFYLGIDPQQNSPNETHNSLDTYIDLDPNSSGFSTGTAGAAARAFTTTFNAQGTGDIGELSFHTNNFTIGNGTDAISANGFSYLYGFGSVANNVTINGPMQGYGFQPNIAASAVIDTNQYTNAFYDGAVYNTPSPHYTSFSASPTLLSVQNNRNATGLQINPNITTFTGNAGYVGVSVGGILGTFGTGGWQGLNVNPTITEVKSAVGVNVSMSNVSLYAGTAAFLVIQDLTITLNSPSANGNNYTVEFSSGGVAGSEVVSVGGNNIQVQIESGVSTATQVKAALDAFGAFTLTASCTISGTAGNAQVTQAPTNLAGGTDPGYKQAANFDGDVNITGNLTFGGALSVGQLSAFYSTPLINGSGNPLTAHGMITQPTVAANATITNGDFIGLNTAMLLTMGDNSTVTSAFLGVAALGLPAVLSLGAGATVDIVSGGLFALSLDGSAGGGTIDTLNLCNALAIPNGVTTVNKLRGYAMGLPFGDPGTQTWGIYIEPTTAMNWMAGSLKVGGTDTPTNSSVLVEFDSTTGAVRLPRMTTAQRNALTALDGMLIFNTTTSALEYYDGAAWV